MMSFGSVASCTYSTLPQKLSLFQLYIHIQVEIYLIRAFKDAAADRPNVRLLLAGRRMDAENDVLMGWICEAGIESRVILLGEQRDVTAIMNGIDIFVLPSISEAFPLALGEAMSCGCYCIATDVGRWIWLMLNSPLRDISSASFCPKFFIILHDLPSFLFPSI